MGRILWEIITIVHVDVVTVPVGHFGLQLSSHVHLPDQYCAEDLNNKEFNTISE